MGGVYGWRSWGRGVYRWRQASSVCRGRSGLGRRGLSLRAYRLGEGGAQLFALSQRLCQLPLLHLQCRRLLRELRLRCLQLRLQRRRRLGRRLLSLRRFLGSLARAALLLGAGGARVRERLGALARAPLRVREPRVELLRPLRQLALRVGRLLLQLGLCVERLALGLIGLAKEVLETGFLLGCGRLLLQERLPRLLLLLRLATCALLPPLGLRRGKGGR